MDPLADQPTLIPPTGIDLQESIWLARVLRAGVLIAAVFVIIGLMLYFFGGHGGPSTLDEALGKQLEVQQVHPADVFDGLRHGSSGDFILTGLLVLILTPTVRVALTVVLFIQHKEMLFAILAAIVLVLLLLGFIGIGA